MIALEQLIRLQYWYLYSYLSFLVVLPFLRSIAQHMDDTRFQYLLILSIVTMDFFPIISIKLVIFGINFNIFLNSVTTLYPLLGYYLDHYGERLIRRWMYPVMGILTILGTFIAVKMAIWNYEK